MPTPRVLFVCHTGSISGAELVLLDLVVPWAGQSAFLFEQGPLRQALADRGLNVSVSHSAQSFSGVRRDSSLLKVIPIVSGMVAVIRELIGAARRHDVVYANSQKAFVLSAVAAWLSRRPLIWHLHDIISPAHFGAAQRRIQVFLANRCAVRVIVPSRVAADAFIAEGGRRNLVTVVPNGLDIAPETAAPAEIRRELDLPAGPLIGVFSRLAEWKGQHVVLQALSKISDVHCIIAGSALFGEEAYEERLRAMVRDLDIVNRVQFLGQRSDVPRLMRAMDAVVHPSIDPEPFGRTLVEAMLADVPVIASDAGAASDILEDGKAGTLVRPGDADGLAAAITQVLDRTPAIAEQVRYAETRARSHYGVTQMIDVISALIRGAAAPKAAC
ncbi:glycosyltransferase family 1 protein [Tardiphaga alba]|uniref:Glycosyltransferase family 1 protein n=1 Tax=Tardiphaga alba TaxID=340268 RepID=A0ABX8AG05_9BRAD|nr:glycosyltransferase family 1 protein [Tardiphaga alba]